MTDPGSNILKRNCFFIRCSRPLCSSQTTTPSHPPPHHSHNGRPAWHDSARETRNNNHPRPATHQKKGGRTRGDPVASGPNSVPNTTHRTTNRHTPFPHHTPKHAAVLKPPAGAAGHLLHQYSTHEHPPQNKRLRNGLYSPHPRNTTCVISPGVRCSLERR